VDDPGSGGTFPETPLQLPQVRVRTRGGFPSPVEATSTLLTQPESGTKRDAGAAAPGHGPGDRSCHERADIRHDDLRSSVMKNTQA
jgi:hypothetical protein